MLRDMKCHTLDMYDAIQRADFQRMGGLIRKTWTQNQAMDSGTNPDSVRAITNMVDDLCLGYKLPGAGGGGYLYMVAKDPEAAARIRKIINEPTFSIEPLEQMLFVGSCFADNIGRRFADEKFRAVVNPYGVMYNPVSILHTVRRFAMPLQADSYDRLVCVFTLGSVGLEKERQ